MNVHIDNCDETENRKRTGLESSVQTRPSSTSDLAALPLSFLILVSIRSSTL